MLLAGGKAASWALRAPPWAQGGRWRGTGTDRRERDGVEESRGGEDVAHKKKIPEEALEYPAPLPAFFFEPTCSRTKRRLREKIYEKEKILLPTISLLSTKMVLV